VIWTFYISLYFLYLLFLASKTPKHKIIFYANASLTVVNQIVERKTIEKVRESNYKERGCIRIAIKRDHLFCSLQFARRVPSLFFSIILNVFLTSKCCTLEQTHRFVHMCKAHLLCLVGLM
jgi:hypothetical protein